MPQKRLEKLQVMLSEADLGLIDDFWFENHLPSRSEAVRELLRRGCCRQQECTDYLGRAKDRRTLPRRLLKTRPEVARQYGNERHNSDRRAESLIVTESREANQL